MTARPAGDGPLYVARLPQYDIEYRDTGGDDLARVMAGVDRRRSNAAVRQLPEFAGDARVVRAAEDKVMPRHHADRLASALHTGPVVEVPDSYTLVPLDRPALLVDLIGSFVRARAIR